MASWDAVKNDQIAELNRALRDKNVPAIDLKMGNQ
jgi:hypothetical protein